MLFVPYMLFIFLPLDFAILMTMSSSYISCLAVLETLCTSRLNHLLPIFPEERSFQLIMSSNMFSSLYCLSSPSVPTACESQLHLMLPRGYLSSHFIFFPVQHQWFTTVFQFIIHHCSNVGSFCFIFSFSAILLLHLFGYSISFLFIKNV